MRISNSYKFSVIILATAGFLLFFHVSNVIAAAPPPTRHLECLPKVDSLGVPTWEFSCQSVDGAGPNKDGCTRVGAGCSVGDIGNNLPDDSELPGIDLTIDSIKNIISGLACWLWSVSMMVIVIFVILAGIQIMYAGGDPGKTTKAKTNFWYVILGALVIMGAYVIIATVANVVGVDISFVPFSCNGGSDDGGDIDPTPSDTPDDSDPGDDFNVLLCPENDYKGSCKQLADDDPNLSDNGINDLASSIRVAEGITVAVYSENDYSGRCEGFTGDDPNLSDNSIGNDSMSSVKFGASCLEDAPSLPQITCNDVQTIVNLSKAQRIALRTNNQALYDKYAPYIQELEQRGYQALAAAYGTAYPATASPTLARLISDIKAALPAGANFGSEFTFEQDHEICNYTRGNVTFSIDSVGGAFGGLNCPDVRLTSCSYVRNSCHYGGNSGSNGAEAVDFGNEALGSRIVQAALANGAKSASCMTAGTAGRTVNCPSLGNSPNILVNATARTCDRN